MISFVSEECSTAAGPFASHSISYFLILSILLILSKLLLILSKH